MKMKKEPSQMDKVTAGYEQFIKGKKVNKNGKELFDKAIKKASKPKQLGSK